MAQLPPIIVPPSLLKMPSVMTDEDLAQLSPRNIASQEKDQDGKIITACGFESQHEHFKCCICTKIVLDPKECEKCQTLFCKVCIEKWSKEKRYCPLQCPDAKYVKIHKFVNNILMELRFNCPMENCPQ